MIKHVGKHNNKRCIILWRKVPNEDHMCLVAYPDLMARHIHDDIMRYLESESGQQADQFSDYLFRVNLSDGENALNKLHVEGMIKKVPTNQVVVTPNNKSTVRLDELNSILNVCLGDSEFTGLITIGAPTIKSPIIPIDFLLLDDSLKK